MGSFRPVAGNEYLHYVTFRRVLVKTAPKSLRYSCGSNLPDKEFRYLRTVIVTAAVHWGFGSKPLTLTFPLTSSTGQASALYVGFLLTETCVLLNSRLAYSLRPFTLWLHVVTCVPSPKVTGLVCRVPTRVAPLALEFSSHLPVSVCGTGTLSLARGFSWQYGVSCFATYCFAPCHTSAMA